MKNSEEIVENYIFDEFPGERYPTFTRGEGMYLFDDQGNKFIDTTCGPVTNSLGHGLPDFGIFLEKQMKNLAFLHRGYGHTPILKETCQKLCNLTHDEMSKALLVCGGSEAVEVAIKMARMYHIYNNNLTKTLIIGRWQSYHGNTMITLSAGGFVKRRAAFIPYLHNTSHIPPAYCYRCWFNKEPNSCNLECAQALEDEILGQGHENVSAFIAEPISGTGLCAAVPREDYFKRVREICDKYDILLIYDEIISGSGRTGKWFGYEHFKTPPDILVLGKGLAGGYFPAGAIMSSLKIYNKIADVQGVLPAGYTWANNPMVATVISKTIDYYQKHNLIANVENMGKYMFDEVKKIQKEHPTMGDVRGKGLLMGIEFVRDKTTKETIDHPLIAPPTVGRPNAFHLQLKKEAKKNHLLLLAHSGCAKGIYDGDMIMLGPYFRVNKEQIDEILSIFEKSLYNTEKEHGFI